MDSNMNPAIPVVSMEEFIDGYPPHWVRSSTETLKGKEDVN